MSITIRDARPEERDTVEALVREAYEDYRLKLSPEVWKLWVGSIGETIHSGNGEVIVACDDDKIVGAVQFFHDVTTLTLVKWPEGAATVRILSVRPAARGRGIGRLLMDECVVRARRRGSSALYILTTGHMVAARRLYERMGFLPYVDFDDSAFEAEEKIEAYRLGL